MMSTPRTQFTVRELRSDEELSECLAIDRSYLSDHVWQMDIRDERGEIAVRFRSVRLPRMVAVEYPRASGTAFWLPSPKASSWGMSMCASGQGSRGRGLKTLSSTLLFAAIRSVALCWSRRESTHRIAACAI